MENKLFMRWSDGQSFTVPFPVNGPEDVINALAQFRDVSDKNAHLHVFVPNSAGHGGWLDPIHRKHIISTGIGDRLAVRPHAETVLECGLISEAIVEFSESDCDRWIESAKKTFDMWQTGEDLDYSAYAMRDSLTVLRADLVANIRRASNDDLIPHPSEETDPAKLRSLANRYGLARDFERAYPVDG